LKIHREIPTSVIATAGAGILAFSKSSLAEDAELLFVLSEIIG
jgi:hypothetical protein